MRIDHDTVDDTVIHAAAVVEAGHAEWRLNAWPPIVSTVDLAFDCSPLVRSCLHN